jgi:hypothetical protein
LVNPLLALAALCWCSTVGAVTVAIVTPTQRSPEMMEAVERLGGELTSEGFSAEFVDVPEQLGELSSGNARPWLEGLAKRRDLDAVVAILGGGELDTVEVWVVDRITGKSVVRTAYTGPADARTPRIISIRALELLRSSLLEVELASAEPQPEQRKPPPETVIRYLESERQKLRPQRFAVELGAFATMALDGFGPALLPVARFDWALQSPFAVYVQVAGLGTRPSISTGQGDAELTHSHVLLGGTFDAAATRTIRPFVFLSGGVLHTTVVGRPDQPTYQGHSPQGYSFLFDAGLGVRVVTSDHLFVSLGVHAQGAHPAPAVRFVGQVVTTWARPNLAVDVSVGSWL